MEEQRHSSGSNQPSASSDSHPISSPPPSHPPPLPPRDSGHLSPNQIPQEISSQQSSSWTAHDPRAASTESLIPSGETDGKRVLLLIYIHGFMGDETSFQSFPAHVHNLVTSLVQRTHVVHTKIYPKYRSRKHIQFARDNFSEWFSPHEGKDVDVILCGHSMGGLLSAEIVLLPPPSPEDPRPFKHRILGTLNFDVPFLGLHPGVVASGIGSLFRPAPKSPQAQAGADPHGSTSVEPEGTPAVAAGASDSSLSLSQPSVNDPNYNPPFPNDVNLPVRKGWASTLHFIQKHSDGLTRATKSYVKSHLEFGGAVTDQLALRARYRAIRALEDIDDAERQSEFRAPRRVRFANYYTASTGILKKSPAQSAEAQKSPSPIRSPNTGPATGSTLSVSHSATNSPRISIEEPKVAYDARLSEDGVPAEHVNAGDASRTPSTPGSFVSFDSTGGERESRPQASKERAEQRTRSKESRSSSHVDPRSSSSTYIPYPAGPSSASETKKEHLSTGISTPASASAEELTNIAPAPEPDSSEAAATSPPPADNDSEFPGLPPVPELPEAPPNFDPSAYADKDARKLAEKEHERRVKAHTRAVKDRDQAIKDRRKMLEKKEREAKKKQQKEEEAAAKKEKDELKRKQKEEEAAYKQWRHELKNIEKKQKAQEKQALEEARMKLADTERPDTKADADGATNATGASEANEGAQDGEHRPAPLDLQGTAETQGEKKRRDRRFCLLPSRDSRGRRDPAWVRVYMRDVDEVIAHCGLFDPWREHYEGFVAEVGDLIKEWVESGSAEHEQEHGTGGSADTWVRTDDDGTERGVVEA